jgi:hypothetical protein
MLAFRKPGRRRRDFGREDEGRTYPRVLDDAPYVVSLGMLNAGAGAGIGSDAADKMTTRQRLADP